MNTKVITGVVAAGMIAGFASADLMWDEAIDGDLSGDYFSVDPANPNVTQLMGYVHYGELDVGQDILPTMGMGPGSQGFTTPVGPGTYSFWVRQGGADLSHWDLNFVVESSTVVPGIGGLAGLMGVGLIRRRRR